MRSAKNSQNLRQTLKKTLLIMQTTILRSELLIYVLHRCEGRDGTRGGGGGASKRTTSRNTRRPSTQPFKSNHNLRPDRLEPKRSRGCAHREEIATRPSPRILDVGSGPVPESHLLELRQEAAHHAQPYDQRALLGDAHAAQLEVLLSQPGAHTQQKRWLRFVLNREARCLYFFGIACGARMVPRRHGNIEWTGSRGNQKELYGRAGVFFFV